MSSFSINSDLTFQQLSKEQFCGCRIGSWPEQTPLTGGGVKVEALIIRRKCTVGVGGWVCSFERDRDRDRERERERERSWLHPAVV
jgi:hypothetical protein